MKKLTYFFAFVLFAAFASCGGGGRASGPLPVIDMSKTSYPEKIIDLKDIAEIEYISPETKEDFFLSNSSVSYLDNDYIIFAERSNKSIVFFDRKTGKGIRSVNRTGKGPEEYSNVVPEIFSAEGEFDEMYVNQLIGAKNIMIYDFDGNFKRKVEYDNKTMYPMPLYSFDKDNFISFDQVLLKTARFNQG